MNSTEAKCALCMNAAMQSHRLCQKCNDERLLAASADRISSGTGLTWSNVDKFSELNWIAFKLRKAK